MKKYCIINILELDTVVGCSLSTFFKKILNFLRKGGELMKDIYYIILIIISILNFCLKYKQSKKHPTTANSKVFLKVKVDQKWFKLNFKYKK